MTFPIYQALSVGEIVPLKTVLGNIYFMGVVTDPNTPNMFAATMEMFGDTAVVTLPILQGPAGLPGQPQFALRFQNDSLGTIPDPDHLLTLTNTEADIGKYWIFKVVDSEGVAIGTTMFVWYGTEYRQLPVGSQGPPGPYPIIYPTIIAEPPGSFNGPSGQQNWIAVSGSAAYPTWTWHVAFPIGPQGLPGEALGQAGDVDLTTRVPQIGDILRVSNRVNLSGQKIWEAAPFPTNYPNFYTVPEAAFTSYSGITGTDVQICVYEIQQQEYDFKPYVTGHLRVFGAQLDPTPFLIGAEVRLGHPTTGQVVARGHGNAWGTINLIPQASTSSQPNNAITPTNAYARIPKAHTGNVGTLYVVLLNEGFASAFDFSAEGAQLDIVTMPVPPLV